MNNNAAFATENLSHLDLGLDGPATNTYRSTVISTKRMEQDAPLHLKDAIFVKKNYRYHKILYQDILYLKADGNYTCIYTTGKNYLIKYSLQAFTSQFLDDDAFARVHRSFTINLQHISSFNEAMAMIHSEEIPIGPNYRAYFMSLFTSGKPARSLPLNG